MLMMTMIRMNRFYYMKKEYELHLVSICYEGAWLLFKRATTNTISHTYPLLRIFMVIAAISYTSN